MPDVLYREMPIAARAEEDGSVTFTASSETPVMRWGDKEILVHTADAVRLDRLNSIGALLVNHDANQRAGAIVRSSIENSKLKITTKFLSTEFGRQIATEVEEGALRGVSVGYMVHQWMIDEDAGEMRAVDWEVYEVSLTPIPADATVGIGRMEKQSKGKWEQIKRQITAEPAEIATRKEAEMPEENKPQAEDTAEMKRQLAEAQRAREQAEQSARTAEMHATIARRAAEFGVHIPDEQYERFESIADGQDYIMREMAKDVQKPVVPAGPGSQEIRVTADEVEKRDAAIEDALCARFNAAEGENLGLRGRSILELGREYCNVRGIKIPAVRAQFAKMLFERSANQSTSNFSTYILANAMSKAVMKGYTSTRVTYQQWTVRRTVPDFKSFTGAALDVGNLTNVVENEVFPEIGKSEDGYSDSLGMWGGTVSLTLQAYINDDLGEFDRLLGRAGAIAQRTIESEVYSQVEDATWTSHTTTTGALGTDGNLAVGVSAFMNRTSAGQSVKLAISPSYLIAPAGLYEDALQKTTQVQGSTEKIVNEFLTPIITPHLTTASTPGNSTYYLAADPNEADTAIVAFLEGVDSPMVMEYDAGAVAERNWKIMMPFVVTLPSNLVGIHQCTQA